MGYAIPDYPYQHAGNLLIVGSAPCAVDDFTKASKYLDHDCDVMAVNEGAALVNVDHIASMHPEKMAYFVELQLKRRDVLRQDFTTHAADKIKPVECFEDFPAVDFIWAGVQGGATSAWMAVRTARSMGYDGQIILCGCPMNGGDGYAIETNKGCPADPRFGYLGPDRGLIKSYKETFALYAKTEGDRVLSMSGYTREILGGP